MPIHLKKDISLSKNKKKSIKISSKTYVEQVTMQFKVKYDHIYNDELTFVVYYYNDHNDNNFRIIRRFFTNGSTNLITFNVESFYNCLEIHMSCKYSHKAILSDIEFEIV